MAIGTGEVPAWDPLALSAHRQEICISSDGVFPRAYTLIRFDQLRKGGAKIANLLLTLCVKYGAKFLK